MTLRRLSASFSATPRLTEAEADAHALGDAWFLGARTPPSICRDGLLKRREWLAHPRGAAGRAA